MSTKILLEKNAKETTTTKNMKACTIFGGFWGQHWFFQQISETTFSKLFLLCFVCLFSTLISKLSRNMRHKVRNGQNLPHESPKLRNNLFLSNLLDNLSPFPQGSDHNTKTVFPQYFFFFYSKLQDVQEHVYLAPQIV